MGRTAAKPKLDDAGGLQIGESGIKLSHVVGVGLRVDGHHIRGCVNLTTQSALTAEASGLGTTTIAANDTPWYPKYRVLT